MQRDSFHYLGNEYVDASPKHPAVECGIDPDLLRRGGQADPALRSLEHQTLVK
jgi:hypothetical protein